VVSADGLTLHRPRTDTPGGVGGADDTMLERESEIGGALEQHVLSLLERTVGPGHAEVRIRVQLDPAARERTEEHYEPSKTALRSEQKVEEHSNGESPSVAGVPGAQSNLPDTDMQANADSEGGGAARTSWTRNWEVDKVTEKTSVPAGKIARLTVAALVDGTQRDVGGRQVWQPRDKAELDRFAELIKGAVGFDAVRGDAIQIDSAEFTKATDTRPATDMVDPAKQARWIYIAIGVGVLALLATIILVSRRRPVKQSTTIAALGAVPETIALESGHMVRALPKHLSREEANAIRGEAVQMAARDPATAAVILREWLNAPSNAT
jgi:flagellar M-ring protein FliF